MANINSNVTNLNSAISAVPYSPPANVNVPGFSALYRQALLARAVLTPRGSGLGQIGSFIFDYTGDEVVQMNNEVTDHWLEDNTAVQDHIGVKPTVVTLKGFTSELTLTANLLNLLSTSLVAVENSFSTLGAYLGKYTPGTTDAMINAITQAENVAIQLEQAAARGLQIYSLFSTPAQWNKQQKAFAQLSAYRNARTIFSIFTPYQIFDNMAITGIQAKQGANSRTLTDFTVTLKQLNFTNPVSNAALQNKFSDVAANTPNVDDGATAGSATTLSPGDGFTPAAATVA